MGERSVPPPLQVIEMQALWFSCCARLRSCSAPIGVTWQQTAYEASSLNSSPVHAWTPLSPFFTGGKQCDARGWFIVPRRSRISDPMTRCWASLHVPPGEAVSSRPGPRSMCRVHAWSPGSPARYYSRQWSRRMFKRRAEREERRPRVAVRAEVRVGTTDRFSPPRRSPAPAQKSCRPA